MAVVIPGSGGRGCPPVGRPPRPKSFTKLSDSGRQTAGFCPALLPSPLHRFESDPQSLDSKTRSHCPLSGPEIHRTQTPFPPSTPPPTTPTCLVVVVVVVHLWVKKGWRGVERGGGNLRIFSEPLQTSSSKGPAGTERCTYISMSWSFFSHLTLCMFFFNSIDQIRRRGPPGPILSPVLKGDVFSYFFISMLLFLFFP